MPVASDIGFGLFQSTFSGFFGSSLKSPFWLALIITVIIILIIIFVYPAKKSASISKLLKLMIYIFAIVLIFMFLHDSAIRELWLSEHEDAKARAMVGNMNDYINNNNKPIIPSSFGAPKAGGELGPAEPRVSGFSNLIN
jgi:magnesium-transporting ATPase (P-type)